jgi:hypothetical protein
MLSIPCHIAASFIELLAKVFSHALKITIGKPLDRSEEQRARNFATIEFVDS